MCSYLRISLLSTRNCFISGCLWRFAVLYACVSQETDLFTAVPPIILLWKFQLCRFSLFFAFSCGRCCCFLYYFVGDLWPTESAQSPMATLVYCIDIRSCYIIQTAKKTFPPQLTRFFCIFSFLSYSFALLSNFFIWLWCFPLYHTPAEDVIVYYNDLFSYLSHHDCSAPDFTFVWSTAIQLIPAWDLREIVLARW